MFSLCPLGWGGALTTKHAETLGYVLPPPGQPGRLLEEIDNWLDCDPSAYKSGRGNSPLPGGKKRLAYRSRAEGTVKSIQSSPPGWQLESNAQGLKLRHRAPGYNGLQKNVIT